MNFSFTEEQTILRDSVHKFLKDEYGFETRRKFLQEHRGFDPKNWQLFADLGWLCIPFSEADGGLDGSAIDIMVLMEEFGKSLVVEPYVPNVLLVGGLLKALATEAQKQLCLTPLINGEKHSAFAFSEANSRYDISAITTTAKQTAVGFTLSGNKCVVLNGDKADFFIVSALLDGMLSLFIVDKAAQGLSVIGYPTQDAMSAADITLDNVQAQLLGVPGDVLSAIDDAIDDATMAICGEAVGAMEALYKTTVEYAQTRKQFGMPIGKFQALQHRMVDMFIHHEQVKSLMYMSAITLRDGELIERRKAVSALKAQVGKAGKYIGQQAVQIHGGMGMTDELCVSHYFKRLTMIELLFGNRDHHLKRFSDLSHATDAAA